MYVWCMSKNNIQISSSNVLSGLSSLWNKNWFWKGSRRLFQHQKKSSVVPQKKNFIGGKVGSCRIICNRLENEWPPKSQDVCQTSICADNLNLYINLSCLSMCLFVCFGVCMYVCMGVWTSVCLFVSNKRQNG